jgi:hypothetical protein
VPTLKLLTLRRLTLQQERFGISPLTADLECPEVLVPESIGCLRFRLPPQLQSIQVVGCDLSLAKRVEEVIPKSGR